MKLLLRQVLLGRWYKFFFVFLVPRCWLFRSVWTANCYPVVLWRYSIFNFPGLDAPLEKVFPHPAGLFCDEPNHRPVSSFSFSTSWQHKFSSYNRSQLPTIVARWKFDQFHFVMLHTHKHIDTDMTQKVGISQNPLSIPSGDDDETLVDNQFSSLFIAFLRAPLWLSLTNHYKLIYILSATFVYWFNFLFLAHFSNFVGCGGGHVV